MANREFWRKNCVLKRKCWHPSVRSRTSSGTSRKVEVAACRSMPSSEGGLRPCECTTFILRFWELTKAVLELGFVQAPFDACCFILFDEKNQAKGFIGVHVDFHFHRQKSFVFTGLTGLQINHRDDYSIMVDQSQYVKDIQPIHIDKDRRRHLAEPINDQERQSFRGLIGSLQYAAVNTGPDIGSRLSFLQSKINKGQILDLIEGNKLLHDAKVHSEVRCKYQHIPKEDVRFVAFSDASFASERTQSSHQGLMVMTARQKIGLNQKSVVNPIVWSSKNDPKGGSQCPLSRINGPRWGHGSFGLVPTLLELAPRSKLSMALRRLDFGEASSSIFSFQRWWYTWRSKPIAQWQPFQTPGSWKTRLHHDYRLQKSFCLGE